MQRIDDLRKSLFEIITLIQYGISKGYDSDKLLLAVCDMIYLALIEDDQKKGETQ